LPYAFGLQQMAALMFRDDFQARTNPEPQQWDEGIPVANAIHIVIACSPGQLPGSLVTAKKSLQNDWFYLPGGFYFPGCPGTRSSRVWSNVGTNEPPAEPAESDFVDRAALAAFHGSGNCRQKDFIPHAEVLQALAYTPRTLPRLPVELNRAESLCNGLGAAIGSVQLGHQALRPRW
jgi:hypothetical protein